MKNPNATVAGDVILFIVGVIVGGVGLILATR